MKIKIIIVLVCFIICQGTVVFAEQEKWKEKRGLHFMIYYQEAPKDFVETVEDSAEDYYNEISRDLGFTRYSSWSWDERAKIYIYNDVDHYKDSMKRMKWSHGMALTRQKLIYTFPSAHGFFDSILPHELGHIIFREFVGYRVAIPLWFEEGIAMTQEKARRWGSDKMVIEAIEDESFIPLDRLTRMRLYSDTPEETIDLFYAESASVVNYLVREYGRQRFVEFCRNLKDGKSFEKSLDDVYYRFEDIKSLNETWIKFIKR